MIMPLAITDLASLIQVIGSGIHGFQVYSVLNDSVITSKFYSLDNVAVGTVDRLLP